jgi:CRP-like cAMP-binding protein
MNEPTILNAFSSHDFLRRLSDQHRLILASGVRPFTATAGQMLAREGDPAHAFYLVQSGHVALETHRPGPGSVGVLTVGPGEVVGWSWLVPPHRWRFDARATDAVSGLAFDAEWLRAKCEEDHELGYQLLKELLAVLATRLAATRLQLLELHR